MIIAIERQRGSGGSEIAVKIAEKLGCECYDRKLIALAAEKSGMSEKLFEDYDERPTNSLLYSLAIGTSSHEHRLTSFGDISMPFSDRLFILQTDLIKSLAEEKENCVFVGRCASYSLRDNPNLISVFITDTESERVKRVIATENVNEKKALELMAKTDKRRANYYNFNTNLSWKAAESYDLCVRTSDLGVDTTAELIIEFAKAKLETED